MNTRTGFNKHTLLSIFERKGAAGTYLHRLDQISGEQWHAIMEGIRLEGDESPLIGGVFPNSFRFMITNYRILTVEDRIVQEFSLSEIVDVVPAKFGAVRKNEMRTLVVRYRCGATQTLLLEEGKSFAGIWNILTHIATVNCAKPK